MQFRAFGAGLLAALSMTTGTQVSCSQPSSARTNPAELSPGSGAAVPALPEVPARPPDQPVSHAPATGPLTVAYVLAHRSALSQSRVTVRGIVAGMLPTDGACANGSGMCAQPRLMMVDTLSDPRHTASELTVLLRTDADADYKVGQRVEISGRVSGGTAGVVIHAD